MYYSCTVKEILLPKSMFCLYPRIKLVLCNLIFYNFFFITNTISIFFSKKIPLLHFGSTHIAICIIESRLMTKCELYSENKKVSFLYYFQIQGENTLRCSKYTENRKKAPVCWSLQLHKYSVIKEYAVFYN